MVQHLVLYYDLKEYNVQSIVNLGNNEHSL